MENSSQLHPRTLILWADATSPNLGVRVLAEGSRTLAQRALDPYQILLQDFDGRETGARLGGKGLLLDALGHDRSPSALLRGAELVLDTGAGDSFTDIYGVKRLTIMAAVQARVIKAGKPLVFMPQTIGPFESSYGRKLARWILGRTTSLMVRDTVSAEVAADLGRTPDLLTSDLVFALPQYDAKTKHDVLVNVSGLLWSPNPHVNHLVYRDAVVGLVRSLAESGREVTLLAHVVEGAVGDNDSVAVAAARDAVKDLSVQTVQPIDLTDARKIIASANLLVGARMHACLNALSQGIPAIPWAYSRKFAPLLENIDWEATVDLRHDDDIVGKTLDYLGSGSQAELRRRAITVAATGQSSIDTVVPQLRAVADGSHQHVGKVGVR